jgi:hypothetical protein
MMRVAGELIDEAYCTIAPGSLRDATGETMDARRGLVRDPGDLQQQEGVS